MFDIQDLKTLLETKLKERLVVCPNCKAIMKLVGQKDVRYLCTERKKCGKRVSLYIHTILYLSKISETNLLTIFYCIYLNFTFKQMKQVVNINDSTLSRILRKIQVLFLIDQKIKMPMIGGPGIVVEIDESKFGKRKYHKGHRVDGVWVLGMVERTEERKIIFVQVPYRTANTLCEYIHKFVKPGSIIYTDKWKGYINLAQQGYLHFTVNHSKHFKDPISGVHTNTIEGNWASLKRFIPVRCRTKNKTNWYLAIYMKNRNNPQRLDEYLINLCF